MKETHNTKKKFSLKDRFQYWFDNRMAKGSLGLIRILIFASVLFAILIGVLIVLLQADDDMGYGATIWDSITTVINAWMPYSEDGSPVYLILMSLVAIAGLLFTSVLIGVFSSAIEEKIDDLKRGNSLVLEQDHIVILGFYSGEYALLNQLILAASGKPTCVVIASDMEREEMEQGISENLDVPDNFRIVCRTADITDPASLEKCSVETCKTIIVSPTDDLRTIKAVLAVSALLEEKGVPEIGVNAIISRSEYCFPPSLAEANNISTLQTNNILAKIIAHSCTHAGLSEAFREVFNFEGSEFYLIDIPNIAGMSFEALMARMDCAVPSGVFRDGEMILNPEGSLTLRDSDRVLVFSEESDSAKMVPNELERITTIAAVKTKADEELTDTVIIGYNETLPIVLEELPENVSHVYLAGQEPPNKEKKKLERIARNRNIILEYIPDDLHEEGSLLNLARMAHHIVVLNDHDRDPEEADMEVIFLLLHLRDIRRRYCLDFNITVEMQKEHNQKLVGSGDYTDFLVSSSMSSLILAQLAESPELINVFREILSNEGNELYLKSAKDYNVQGVHSIQELRIALLRNHYILLGFLDGDKKSTFNSPLEKTISLGEDDYLIVLGET